MDDVIYAWHRQDMAALDVKRTNGTIDCKLTPYSILPRSKLARCQLSRYLGVLLCFLSPNPGCARVRHVHLFALAAGPFTIWMMRARPGSRLSAPLGPCIQSYPRTHVITFWRNAHSLHTRGRRTFPALRYLPYVAEAPIVQVLH